jgi:hypothetical protein
VPFLIWFNAAALGLEIYNVSHPSELTEPVNENIFSAPFFGAYVMELLGMKNISPFWDFIMEERTKKEESNLYRDWSYFKLFNER